MAASEVPSAPRKRGTATTIKLRSGGSITLTMQIDLFTIASTDREFVLGIVDSLAAYGKEPSAQVPLPAAPAPVDAKSAKARQTAEEAGVKP